MALSKERLIRMIDDRDAVVGIIGLGYVGLPLAMTYAKKFAVRGYDISVPLIERLNQFRSNIQDVPDSELRKCVGKTLIPSNDPSILSDCDFIIICVPTPLADGRIPDLTYIKDAGRTISSQLREGQFIILESTTYPGTTAEILVPILERSGLKAGIDFGVAYSPERIDPGNRRFAVEEVPKVVGGIDDTCTEVAVALYSSVITHVHKVRDTQTAESVKMVENIFRNVNIALVNELALIFEHMGIDTWEVIDAAATKPYGFMAFYPGPGIGGHCIPLDPYYMSYKAKKFGFIPRFIETSGEINEYMKVHAINLAERGLKRRGERLFGAKVAVIGLAYKKDINDPRESPAIDIIDELSQVGANVLVYDPYIPSIKTKTGTYVSEKDLETAIRGCDCAMFLVNHQEFTKLPLDQLKSKMKRPLIVDCRNIFDAEPDDYYYAIGKANK